jgi:ABC-type polysaccharide/polyol phosphate transport system ATPase subunit
MRSTVSSKSLGTDILVEVRNVRMFFELEYYQHQGLRDVFVEAVTHPLEYLFRRPELFFVLDDVSFNLTRGMRLGIIGVNGSGKTTLCRCIAGMMKPQRGQIISSAEIRAIFDTGTGIMPELTGRENAQLLARLFFPQVRDLKPLVDEALEFSELGSFVNVPFKQYSKGMQARLMLSLISARASDVLILDEVFDGADVFFQKKLSQRMKKFIADAGATIFVSHSAEQVREVCTHVMVMEKGKMTFFGDVEAGLNYYTSSPT